MHCRASHSKFVLQVCQQVSGKYRNAVPVAGSGCGTCEPVPACKLLDDIIVKLAVACNRHSNGQIYEREIPSVCKKDLQAALSTALSLTIKSLTSQNRQESLLHLGPPQSTTAEWAWPSFAQLCARVAHVQFTDNEALAAAAARCVYLLLTTSAHSPINGNSAAHQGALTYSTARTLCQASALFSATAASLKCDFSPGQQPDIEYPSTTAAPAPPAATIRARLHANLLRSIAAVFDALSCDSVEVEDHIAAVQPGTPLAAACSHLTTTLLASPAILVHYSTISAALERSKRQLLLSLLVFLAGNPAAPPGSPHATLFALTATTVLLAGPKEALSATTSQIIFTLQPCALLRDPLVARAFLAASARVLAASRGAGPPATTATRHLLHLQAWPFTQNVFLLDLLHASKAGLACWPAPETAGDEAGWDGLDATLSIYHAWIQVWMCAPHSHLL